SVRDVIDNTGELKDQISYDGFGRITESDPEFGGRYKWTSREFDQETEFQFNRGRYYDAATGRWISQDPLGFDAGDSNLYRYVNNRPTQYTDPTGKAELPPPDYRTFSQGGNDCAFAAAAISLAQARPKEITVLDLGHGNYSVKFPDLNKKAITFNL